MQYLWGSGCWSYRTVVEHYAPAAASVFGLWGGERRIAGASDPDGSRNASKTQHGSGHP